MNLYPEPLQVLGYYTPAVVLFAPGTSMRAIWDALPWGIENVTPGHVQIGFLKPDGSFDLEVGK